MKSWKHMPAEEKTDLALRTLDSLTSHWPAHRTSSTEPGPMPIDEMMFLQRVMCQDSLDPPPML